MSLYRAFAGVALAVAVGVVVGIAKTRMRWVAWLADPLVALGFPSPKTAVPAAKSIPICSGPSPRLAKNAGRKGDDTPKAAYICA